MPVERRSRVRMNAVPGTRVLIIDDSRTIVAALTEDAAFGRLSSTIEAFDAEIGLETAARPRPVELIFLDIVLPGMNGFSALARTCARIMETRERAGDHDERQRAGHGAVLRQQASAPTIS